MHQFPNRVKGRAKEYNVAHSGVPSLRIVIAVRKCYTQVVNIAYAKTLTACHALIQR